MSIAITSIKIDFRLRNLSYTTIQSRDIHEICCKSYQLPKKNSSSNFVKIFPEVV